MKFPAAAGRSMNFRMLSFFRLIRYFGMVIGFSDVVSFFNGAIFTLRGIVYGRVNNDNSSAIFSSSLFVERLSRCSY